MDAPVGAAKSPNAVFTAHFLHPNRNCGVLTQKSSRSLTRRAPRLTREPVAVADLTREFVTIMESDDIKAKRETLTEFGSNLIWNEEKLSIINKEWANILAKGLKEARCQNPRFEPRNIVDTSDSNEVFASVRPILLRMWDDVRKSIIAENGNFDKNAPGADVPAQGSFS
ncbi:MAG: hypothetical protein WDN67_05030 [Candidatus Moraniibacteriota bacterium]